MPSFSLLSSFLVADPFGTSASLLSVLRAVRRSALPQRSHQPQSAPLITKNPHQQRPWLDLRLELFREVRALAVFAAGQGNR
jgi:hypothetical protein